MDIFEIWKKKHKGQDPSFPYLDENQRYRFPLPEESNNDSIIAWGGNLSPGMLLSAYEQGLFPWYSEGEPLLWHSPDPRFVIFPEKLLISQSMRKILRQGRFEITLDTDFEGVIKGCSEIYRPGQDGTWITKDIIAAYTELHRLGWAHSAEARISGQKTLAGGCYGINLGGIFFGESMFSYEPNASKAAFLSLAAYLFGTGTSLIDCQVPTNHLESLGGERISRTEYLQVLHKAMAVRQTEAPETDIQDNRGKWRLPGKPLF
ncbi:MAG: leucyl/phenylalanyl-tRNA--protein transferase [Treponema sp.]|nr:leucyl/phenylalanyl-tRNA--protein transferase [Treponema sp.]